MKKSLTASEIVKGLDALYPILEADEEVHSVETEYGPKGTYLLVTVSARSKSRLPRKVVIRSRGKDLSIPVKRVVGPKIVPALYYVKKGERLDSEVRDKVLGGDRIWRIPQVAYGTIGFTAARIQIRSTTHTADTGPAVISNNHVIANLDQGHVGDPLGTEDYAHFADLDSWLRVKSGQHVDLALGKVLDPASTDYRTVRTIGRIGKDHATYRPNMRLRKHGAKTGYTYGKLTGFADIRVNDDLYRHVGVTSRGFICKGDSGSVVVNKYANICGFVFAVEEAACGSGKGFFLQTLYGGPPKFDFRIW